MQILFKESPRTDGDMVVIINCDKVPKLKMTGQTSSLTCNTLHSASIAKNAICMVVDHFKARFIELSCSVGLGDCKANSIAESLTKGTSSDFDSRGIMRFRMTWSNAVYLLYIV
jgi:hypothetical protein